MFLKQILVWLVFVTIVFAQLPNEIEDMISRSGIPSEDISISIKEAGISGRRVASLNPEVERMPASTIKIATTYAALLELGSNYKWKTVIYTAGEIKNGVLDGDLVIKGYGDPTFSTDDVIQISRVLYSKGIRSINGDIIIDRSYFEPSNNSSAHFDDHPYSPYNAMPDAMMFNQNTTTLYVKGDNVSSDVADQSYDIENELVSVDNSCTGRYSWPFVQIIPSAIKPKIVFSGKMSSRCSQRKITQILTKSYLACYYSFYEQLNRAGIRFSGRLKLGNVPSNAKENIIYYSKPLIEIISETNKESNNLFARQIFLTLGAQLYGPTSTLGKSRKALTAILNKHNVSYASMLKADNGSGLSKSDRVTSAAFESLLGDAYSKYNQTWLQTLSIAGVDGTIKRRFPSYLHRRIWMKTGTIKGVKNIAGYVNSKDGKAYTVVILINSPKASSSGVVLENNIIKWVGDGASYAQSVQPKNETNSSAPTKQALDDKYFIQVGTFSGSIKHKLLNSIKSNGFDYRLLSTKIGSKVLIGPYDSRKDAKSSLRDVRKLVSHEAFIVTF
ncbi:MAG: D-alanyl-D-alanine carboxypeptidase/D-alanyl-D-alanine-endopeptidase [Sulfurovaceae bacterium]|nr:D-alanyl-D-alanine carboxypeptidase/D-alanyl-D-alanine-endopeptidase [Sulfurovaceae bacterium]